MPNLEIKSLHTYQVLGGFFVVTKSSLHTTPRNILKSNPKSVVEFLQKLLDEDS